MDYKLMDMHNHTMFSDGIHSGKVLVENAIENKIDCIGISDHFETSKCNSLPSDNLDRYIRAIDKLKEVYGDRINILAGIEIYTLFSITILND